MSDDDLIRRGDALALMQRAVDAYGYRMRGAADKKEKRDWQSMLFAAVDIQSTLGGLPAVSIQPMIDAAVKAALERAVEACRQAETDWNAIAYEKRQAGKDDNFACACASASRKNAETIRAMIP